MLIVLFHDKILEEIFVRASTTRLVIQGDGEEILKLFIVERFTWEDDREDR